MFIFISENDKRYCLTEKFIHEESTYVTCLKSAKELYGDPLGKMDIFSVEEYDLVFEKLSNVANECFKVVNEVSK